MRVRDADAEDIENIRGVARDSLVASVGHALDDGVIDDAVERWYDVESLENGLRSDDALLVAEDGDRLVGFAQGYVVERRERVGEVDWLHVSPSHRGQGVGTELLCEVENRLRGAGVERIEGRVLAANEAETELFAARGFDSAGEATVEIGGETFAEHRRIKQIEGDAGEVLLEARTTTEGERRYVAYDERERGAFGPFYVTYADPDRDERHGWYCGNCGGFETAMDAMGRVECNGCGNRRKPSRWDAAYL